MWLSGRVLASHIRGPEFQPQHCQKWINIVHETLSWKTLCKKGLEEWLKVQALSSNPITAHTQKKPINEQINVIQCEQSWSDLRKTLKLSCWQWADWSQRPHILSRKKTVPRFCFPRASCSHADRKETPPLWNLQRAFLDSGHPTVDGSMLESWFSPASSSLPTVNVCHYSRAYSKAPEGCSVQRLGSPAVGGINSSQLY
jgi:hypothetical protein